MKLRDKIIVKIRLLQLRADRIIKEKVSEAIKKQEVEETKGCDHTRLKKITETWYRCTKCGLVIDLFDAKSYGKKDAKKLFESIIEGIK